MLYVQTLQKLAALPYLKKDTYMEGSCRVTSSLPPQTTNILQIRTLRKKIRVCYLHHYKVRAVPEKSILGH